MNLTNIARLVALFAFELGLSSRLFAEAPTANYSFPAGGQRGTTVAARLGGCNLHDSPRLLRSSRSPIQVERLLPIDVLWFEGPLIPQPASQQKEDYPRDFSTPITIAPAMSLGTSTWRLATSQGVTPPLGFVVGDFAEVVEDEAEGATPAVQVALPITINGRIFPREDIDAWCFSAKAGEIVTCSVATSSFGSPLEARLEVRDSAGRSVGEQLPEGAATPALKFTATVDGLYEVRIHDIAFRGLQDFVYRLTVTAGSCLDGAYPLGGRRGTKTLLRLSGVNLLQPEAEFTLPSEGSEFIWRIEDKKSVWGEVKLDVDDFDNLLEVEPNDRISHPFTIPIVLNGRIQQPGDVDVWRFNAAKGIEYQFETRAARLGSPLDSVLELTDASGKLFVEADDSSAGQTDARLRFTAPADGEYLLRVRDRLASRGGSRFAYRVRVTSTEQPNFNLSLVSDFTNLERGKSASVKVLIDRGPGFREPVTIEVEGLPPGVTLASPSPLVIAPNQNDVQVQFQADDAARIMAIPLKIIGRSAHGTMELLRTASVSENVPLAAGDTAHWLAVTLPTPFKFVGIFETKFIPRGAVFVRKYRVERNGFEGPLVVQLADRQGRHLQGVTASPITIPSGQNDFEFAVTLPPLMEIGRTCRSTLVVSGVVSDPDSTLHTVSYSSNDQNNQMIALVDPGRLAIQLSRTTCSTTAGQRIELPFRLQRDRGMTNSVALDLVVPKGCRGVTAAPLEILAGESSGTLQINVDASAKGFDLRPLTIRATTRDERGLPVTAETALVLAPSQ